MIGFVIFLSVIMDLIQITEICNDNYKTINFLMENNLLKKDHYCCDKKCSEVKSKSSDGLEVYFLLIMFSIRTHSSFYNVHIKLQYLLLLIYLFTCKTPVNLACVYLKQKISRKSIQNWYGLLRDVMTRKLIQNGIQLGGPNCIVELDEAAIGHKCKYNRGFFRGSGIKWVLGILDISMKKCVLPWVPNRS